MNVVFHAKAFAQYVEWLGRDRATRPRINRLITECQRHPFEGAGKLEPLKGDYSGWWSRRIDQKHRLVYKIEVGTLFIAQCRFHYSP